MIRHSHRRCPPQWTRPVRVDARDLRRGDKVLSYVDRSDPHDRPPYAGAVSVVTRSDVSAAATTVHYADGSSDHVPAGQQMWASLRSVASS